MLSVRIRKKDGVIWFKNVTAVNFTEPSYVIICTRDDGYYSSTAHYIDFRDMYEFVMCDDETNEIKGRFTVNDRH